MKKQENFATKKARELFVNKRNKYIAEKGGHVCVCEKRYRKIYTDIRIIQIPDNEMTYSMPYIELSKPKQMYLISGINSNRLRKRDGQRRAKESINPVLKFYFLIKYFCRRDIESVLINYSQVISFSCLCVQNI